MSINLSMIKDLAKLTIDNPELWLFNIIPALRLAGLGNQIAPSAVPDVAQWLNRRVTAGTASRQQVGALSTKCPPWHRHSGVALASARRGVGPTGSAGPTASTAIAGALNAGGATSSRTFGPTGGSFGLSATEQVEFARRAPLPDEDASEASSVTGVAGDEGGAELGVDSLNAARSSLINPRPGKLAAGGIDSIPMSAEELERNIAQYRIDMTSKMVRFQRLQEAANLPLPAYDVTDSEGLRALNVVESSHFPVYGSALWVSNEEKAFSYMLLTMSPDFQEMFRGYGSCQEIYDEVETWATQKARRMGPKLVADLRAVQMAFTESPTTYFTRVKKLALLLLKSGTIVSEFQCIEIAIAGASHPRFAALLTLFSGPEFVENQISFAEVQFRYESIDTANQRLLSNHPHYPPWVLTTFPSAPSPLPAMAAAGVAQGSGLPQCIYCPRPGHSSENCFKQFPALRPKFGASRGARGGPKKNPSRGGGAAAAAPVTRAEFTALLAQIANLAKKVRCSGSPLFFACFACSDHCANSLGTRSG